MKSFCAVAAVQLVVVLHLAPCCIVQPDGMAGFSSVLWRSPLQLKSAKIVPATTARSWLFPKISANPLFTLAEKRRFCPLKTARTAGRRGRAGAKSAKPFSPASPLAASPSAESRPQALRLLCCSSAGHSRTSAQRPVFWLWRVRARLCPESRTNRRHGRDGVNGAAGHSCISCICSDSDIFGCGSVVIAYH